MTQVKAPRQFPKWRELKPLLAMDPPALTTADRLRRAATIHDLRALSKRRAPKPVFEYVDGAAEGEVSMAENRATFDQVRFTPRVLRDVGRVDPSTTILGAPSSMPLVLGPTGFTRMMHTDGERAVAAAAAAKGIPYTLSTMGTTTPEDLIEVGGTCFFQLYVWRDAQRAADLIQRVRRAGYTTLVVTVDTAVAGARHRDSRNGFAIPPRLTVSTMARMAMRPRWALGMLTTPPVEFACAPAKGENPSQIVGGLLNPSFDVEALRRLREDWTGKLVVKGILDVDDAKLCADLGADGIVLSNHGGRQLDRTPTPIQILPEVVAAVGDRCEVFIDSGIRTGSDVVAAVALGARAAWVGRAYLYGLMAGGQAGVERALDIFRSEIDRTLALLGASSLAAIEPGMVSLGSAT